MGYIMKNKMPVKFDSISENEAFARNVIASFLLPIDPAIEELSDIKTAVSEAVTNAIVHGYPDTLGEVTLSAELNDGNLHITVADKGVGIADLDVAMQPFYTTRGNEERSGMGFTIIKAFMDEVEVKSAKNEGTVVEMYKKVKSAAE